MRSKNNKIFHLGGLLFFFSACGLNTGGRGLRDLTQDSIISQYYQTPSGSMQIHVERNTPFNANIRATRLFLFMVFPPESHPRDASPFPDFTYALRIQMSDAPVSTENSTQDALSSTSTTASPKDAPKPPAQTPSKIFLLTFGDLKNADHFLIPQEKDEERRLAITNLQYSKKGWWFRTSFQKNSSLAPGTLPSIFCSCPKTP